MNKSVIRLLLLTAALIFNALTISAARAAFTFDPSLDWKTLTTEHFYVHFHNQEESLVQEAAAIAERTHERLSRFFQWTPVARTEMILIDRMDFTNGYSTPLPRNTMVIIVSPPSDLDVFDNYHNWLESLITHEYTHILHLDKALGSPESLRRFFGRLLPLFPNALQPSWVVEGIATYQESLLGDTIGRGNNNFVKGVMRLEVENGVKPLRQVNQPMVTWPAGHTRYLYGVYFFNFLQQRYGVDQIKNWVNAYSDNLIPFLFNSNAKTTFHKNMSAMWEEFSAYLTETLQPQIDQLKAEGLREGERLTTSGYYTGAPVSLSNGEVYFARQDFRSDTKLMRLSPDRKTAEEIATIHTGNFDIHPEAGALLAQLDAVNNVNIFSDLYRLNLKTRDITRLTVGQRYIYACWSPDGRQIAAVKQFTGNAELQLLDDSGKYLQTLWSGSNKEVVSQPVWSADGATLLAAVWRPQSNWNIESFDLASRQWRAVTQTPDNEFNPRFSHDGKAVIFSADYDGVYNIYRLEIGANEPVKLTNVMGGTVSGALAANDRDLYYAGLNKDGADLYFLAESAQQQTTTTPLQSAKSYAEAPPIQSATETNVANPASTDQTQANTYTNIHDYNALPRIVPTAWFPYASWDSDQKELGLVTAGSDPLQWHMYGLLAAYDVENDWFVGAFDYRYDRWNPSVKLYFERDVNILRDSQNGLNRFVNSDSASLELLFPHFTRDRQWTFSAGITREVQSDKKLVAPGALSAPDFIDELLGAAVNYNSAQLYPRGISLERGQHINLVATDSDTLNSDYTGQVYTLDWRAYLPLSVLAPSQVLALRVAGGWGNDAPRPFRLGGNTEGYYLPMPGATLLTPTIDGDVFGKRKFALRGYKDGLPQLTGRRMALAETEWRFPLKLVERGLMAPPLGIHQIHGKLFYNAGSAWDDQNDADDIYKGAGAELNTELVIGYLFGINLRMGYAHGFDKPGDNEWYLELGATF